MADERWGAGSAVSVDGTVLAILPRGLYRVGLDGGRDVTAHARTGPGRNFVRLVVGDAVRVELSARDAQRGRIVRKRSTYGERLT